MLGLPDESVRKDFSDVTRPIDVRSLIDHEESNAQGDASQKQDYKTTEQLYDEEEKQNPTSTIMRIFIDDQGYVTFPDGSKYKGGLYGGIPEGRGRILYTDGSVYDGDWRSGNSHGQGTLKFPDGSFYQG